MAKDAAVCAAVASVPAPISRPKKNQRVRRQVRDVQRLVPHLNNPIFRRQLGNLGLTSVLIQDSYEEIRRRGLINPETGELRASIDTIRKLVDSYAKQARELGITPSTLKALGHEKSVDIAAKFAEVDDGEPE